MLVTLLCFFCITLISEALEIPFRTDVSCDFDTADLCGYSQSADNVFNWNRTSSVSVADSAGRGSYIYIDLSTLSGPGDAYLLSPILSTSSSVICVMFDYYLSGSDVGMFILALNYGAGQHSVFMQNGEKGQTWKRAAIELSNFVDSQIIFTYVHRGGSNGDVAVDDVTTTVGSCPTTTSPPAPTTTAPAPTTTAPAPTTTPAPATTTQAPTTKSGSTVTPSASATAPPVPATTTLRPATTVNPRTATSSHAGQTTPSPVVPFQTSTRFTCLRPTTQCDANNGYCQQTTGRCVCSNQAWGLQCQILAPSRPNQGVCLTNNPCRTGVCYDDAGRTLCACADGFYGRFCQFRMVNLECHRLGMVINVFPYGYDPGVWVFLPAPITARCPLLTVPAFVQRYPVYQRRAWSGFAGAFYHRNDRCAGNAQVTETATEIRFSRDVYVYYSMNGRHPTDSVYRLACIVHKTPLSTTSSPPDPQPALPQARVTYNLINQKGQRLTQPVRLGETVGIIFRLQPVPNRYGANDMKVETCVLMDNQGQNRIIVVNYGSAVGPMGRLLYKPRDRLGISLLVMTLYRFPGGTSRFSFQCRVRLCKSTDFSCRTQGYNSTERPGLRIGQG